MTIYYFAYGSNMLARCLHGIAPSALRVDLGKLNHFRLEFAGYSEQCRGALVTVVPAKDATVYGTIWKVNRQELDCIDKLETSGGRAYRALDQCVERANGSMMLCRMHQQTQPPHNNNDPQMRWKTMPSLTYLDTIREGAKESNLPEEYVKFLFNLSDNGRTTSLDNMLYMDAVLKKDTA